MSTSFDWKHEIVELWVGQSTDERIIGRLGLGLKAVAQDLADADFKPEIYRTLIDVVVRTPEGKRTYSARASKDRSAALPKVVTA